MTATSDQVIMFFNQIKKICSYYGTTPNIRKVEFTNELGSQVKTAYIQDIVDQDRIVQFMLDAGGNVWENYQCYGPIEYSSSR